MTAYISECGYCHETQFTQWYSRRAPHDRHGRVDRDYVDSRPVAFCSEEHRDAADALLDQMVTELLPTSTDKNANDDVRELLGAVLEALNIPHPATIGGTEAHDRLLNTRAMHAKIALQNLLDDGPDLGPAWSAKYLRERLANHPVTGYVTVDQAHAALAAGKSWSEAVAPPAGEDQ